MLIGIVGTICSGKHTTAEYLVQHHGFLRLHLPSAASLATNGTEEWKRLLPSVTDEKGTRGLTFPDVNALLDFVTKRWREHWVLTDIIDEATLEALLRRPFFLLISVDAPMSLRHKRFNDRCTRRSLTPASMEDFVHINDTLLYGSLISSTNHEKSLQLRTSTTPSKLSNHSRSQSHPAPKSSPQPRTGTAHLSSHSHLQILNHTPSIALYYTSTLDPLDLPSPTRLRPPWDAYFMHLAHLASLRSNCMKRRVGCVLVHHSRIISTGYNGTPRYLTNCNEGGCPRCNDTGVAGGVGLSTCLCLHAEENALLEAGRERIREGSVLYCDTCPCLTCSVKIAQVGVKEVVYSQSYNMDEDSRRVLGEAGVLLRQYSPPKSGLVVGDLDFEGVVEGENEVVDEARRDGGLVVRNGGSEVTSKR